MPKKFELKKLKGQFPDVDLPSDFPFPYIPEKFTIEEKRVLLNFFTNTDKPVFAIYNLPQEVIGAMFSRYSRSAKSVRRLFLDEFWTSDALGIRELSVDLKSLEKARERTANFYKRVFAEYGDDSVIQMGSVHIAFEFVSQMIGAKAIEDQRVAAAYIEKSTRYVDFGSKVGDHYLFMEPTEIMGTSFYNDFVAWNNLAFDLYNKNLPVCIEYLRRKYPLDKQLVEDTKTGKSLVFAKLTNDDDKIKISAAYERALKAKAFDTIRFFLPLTTVTNLGAHFSGHTAENTINKMLASPYEEARVLGYMAYEELKKVIPNFLQNIDHNFGNVTRDYRRDVKNLSVMISQKFANKIKLSRNQDVTLVFADKDADIKLASQILFTSGISAGKTEIDEWCKKIKKKEGQKWSSILAKIIQGSVPDRKAPGVNRRQKLPRAFEHANVELEICSDIGAYKDLQRNRLSSTERQDFNPTELYIPKEYLDGGMEEVLTDYKKLHTKTISLYKKISGVKKLKFAKEYICILGNKVHYNIKANLRQWVFFSELRTIAGGHPSYRKVMQLAAREIIEKYPFMEKLFTHVDWIPDYGLGRMKAEISTQDRLAKIK